MNRREANERLVAELLQACDAVRRTPYPSHFGSDLTPGPPLAAGEVVTTGTLTSLPYLRPGESYRVEVAGAPLAPVQLELDDCPAERGVIP